MKRVHFYEVSEKEILTGRDFISVHEKTSENLSFCMAGEPGGAITEDPIQRTDCKIDQYRWASQGYNELSPTIRKRYVCFGPKLKEVVDININKAVDSARAELNERISFLEASIDTYNDTPWYIRIFLKAHINA